MKDGWKNQTVLTAAAIVISILLFLIPVCHAGAKAQDSEATAEGKAYVEAEADRDPAEIMKTIQAAGQTAEDTGEAQDASENDGITGEDGTQTDETAGEDTAQAADEAAGESTAESSGTAQVDITELQSQIDSLNITQLTDEQIADYGLRLGNVQFVGDSMTQAIYDYGLLDGDHVWYVRGASIGELGGEIQSAIDMLPESIVFFTGANAVDYYDSADKFTEAYKNQCNNILTQRPDMKIYICSLLPVSDAIAAYREDLTKTTEYDQALQQMCSENGFNYIDLNWMVKQELYIEDGIHFGYDFYQIWIQYIAMTLGV